MRASRHLQFLNSRRAIAAAFCLLGLALAGAVLIARVGHDESQYWAAAELTVRYRPFRDFLSLQMPLHPLVMAPFVALSESWSLITLRLATAAMDLGTLFFVYACQRRLGVGPALAFGCALLLLATRAFQSGAFHIRNDSLAALLEAVGLYFAIVAIVDPKRRALAWFATGLALGCAVSTKISFAPLLGAAALFSLAGGRGGGTAWRDSAAVAVGAVIGLLPAVIARAASPEAFDYGVVHYALQAPFDYYRSIGRAADLTLSRKLFDSAVYLCWGPAAAALVLVALAKTLERGDTAGRAGRFLNLMILAGALAGLLPTPTWPQYMIPILPPLFVRLGMVLSEDRHRRYRRTAFAALALFCLPGAALPLSWAAGAWRGETTALAATAQAQWIGRELRGRGLKGEIATLSPQWMLDSGFGLDRRFATGPFFYRTGDRLEDSKQARLNAVSGRTLDAALDSSPPVAILVGFERVAGVYDLDERLRNYAQRHGYRPLVGPDKRAVLYIKPQG